MHVIFSNLLPNTKSVNRTHSGPNVLGVPQEGEYKNTFIYSLYKNDPENWGDDQWCHSLNFHSCLHMGHCCWTCWEFSHFKMQCMWKQWEHWPQTSGQSSPGTLQSGQQPLKGILQIPQFSSLATQSHEATPFHCRILTFILLSDSVSLASHTRPMLLCKTEGII